MPSAQQPQQPPPTQRYKNEVMLRAKFDSFTLADTYACLSKEEGLADFRSLVQTTNHSLLNRTLFGVKASEHFMARFRLNTSRYQSHRPLHATVKARPTISEVWASPERKESMFRALMRLSHPTSPEDVTCYLMKNVYSLNHGVVGHFRPMVAKYIFENYSRSGRVVDFSSGWGDRLLGAMASKNVISYTGIDNNPQLQGAYRKMINLYGTPTLLAPTGKTEFTSRMVVGPSEVVDFGSFGSFDCVFSSPPYFMVEKYIGSPVYADHKAWLDTFLFSTLDKCIQHIDSGGHIVINIKQEATELALRVFMRSRGWMLKKRLEMGISHLPSKNPVPKSEPIYVFVEKKVKAKPTAKEGPV